MAGFGHPGLDLNVQRWIWVSAAGFVGKSRVGFTLKLSLKATFTEVLFCTDLTDVIFNGKTRAF